jgi:hypothetical protein
MRNRRAIERAAETLPPGGKAGRAATEVLTLLSLQPSNVSDAAWDKAAITVAEDFADNAGGTSAESLLETATTAQHAWTINFSFPLTVTAGVHELVSVIKPVSRTWAHLAVYSEDYGSRVDCYFDLAGSKPGTSSNSGAGLTFRAASITPLGSNGYMRCALRFSTTITPLRPEFYIRLADATDANHLGDITKGFGHVLSGLYRVA